MILTSAILAEAEYLLRMGLSVPEVCSGLQVALDHAKTQLEGLVVHSVSLDKLRDPKEVNQNIQSVHFIHI